MTKYLDSNFDLNSDQLVGLIDELPIWSAPFGLKLLDGIKFRKNITVLDIGFGAGFPLTELAMRLGHSCKVYGIDPWEAGIKRTEQKIKFYGIENVDIIHGVAENIPLEDHSVDLITSNNGINNVSDLDKVLSECSRILKKGGQFLQTMNLDTTMIEFYDILKDVLESFHMEAELTKLQEHIYEKRKPIPEFTGLLEQHNFSVIKVEKDRFEYKFTDGTTLLNHYFIRLAFLDEWKRIVPVNRQKEIFSLIENKMNEKAEKDRYFILSVPFVLIDCERK
jgi:arsenite methyltransferase